MFFEGSYSTKDDNHNFLRMLDLQNIKCNLVTEYDDGYQLGLPVNVLKGHSKYKCCFCFELPKKLLDNQCIHDMPSHLDLLPSVIQNKSTLGLKIVIFSILFRSGFSTWQKGMKIFNQISSRIVTQSM